MAENEDVDYYAVEAKKGERITAEIEGLRLGITFFDPYVAILDTKRFELARSDDAPLVRQDCIAIVIAPEDGTYIIEARETSFAGNGSCRYRLHVGTLSPAHGGASRSAASRAKRSNVEWLGDVAGPRKEQITLPAAQRQVSSASLPRTTRASRLRPIRFGLTDLNNVLEAEPNNALAEGTPCEAPIAMNGVIGEAKDVDCFKFAAKKGQVFDVRVFAREYGSPLDSVLNVFRVGGAHVGANDDGGGYAAHRTATSGSRFPKTTPTPSHSRPLGQGGPTTSIASKSRR